MGDAHGIHDAPATTGQLLLQVCRLTGERMRRKMEAVGLHPAQGPALFLLGHHEGAPQSEIARLLRLTPASVSTMLRRMERDGWVERRADPADQRVSRVYLTQRAHALHAEAEDCFRVLEDEIAACLAPDEPDELRRLLSVVRSHLIATSPRVGGDEATPPNSHGGTTR